MRTQTDAVRESKGIWAAFGRALGAEPREALTISGISGLTHSVEAVAVDDKGVRVIVVAAESNPRVAALMQNDIQATMQASRVLVVRPIIFDVPAIARSMAQEWGLDELDLQKISKKIENSKKIEGEHIDPKEVFGSMFVSSIMASEKIKLPTLTQILTVIEQLSFLDWPQIRENLKKSPEHPGRLIVPLMSLAALDTMQVDRSYGVCPVPLYELTEQDWELFLSGTKIDEIEERLKRLGIHQYFFPPPDQIALGLTDRAPAPLPFSAISTAVELAPRLGHPLGAAELVRSSGAIPAMLEELQNQGLLVEGELGFEMTAEGATARATVKFRPRESLLSKLLQRMNVNFSLSGKDFIPPS